MKETRTNDDETLDIAFQSEKQGFAQQAPSKGAAHTPHLAVVFDIDGTLIAEGKRVHRVIMRPDVVDFLHWLKYDRNHHVAIWTAAHMGWANTVARRLCQAVQQKNSNETRNNSHVCSQNCRATFDFVWDGSRMRKQSLDQRCHSFSAQVAQEHNEYACQWCRAYRFKCSRCECGSYKFGCPCRFVKDMGKVWSDTTNPQTRFFRDRKKTLIVENTPQQCIYNYGNAIYVPTYRGGHDEAIVGKRDGSEKVVETYFEKMKKLIIELETADDVRFFQKCSHGAGGMHACLEQTWWTYPSLSSGFADI